MSARHDETKTGLEPIARRVPIRSKIELHFHNFEGLVTGVSANLSTSGMFIQTDSPEAVGSECSFQIRIEDWSPIQGTAEVIWTRAVAEGPERPAGMGVRFLELDSQTRRMIRWLVDKHLEDGGQPYDPTRVPAGASSLDRRKIAAKFNADGQERTDAVATRSGISGRQIVLGVVAVILLTVSGYSIYVLWLDRQIGRGKLAGPDPGRDSVEVETGTEVGTEAPSETADVPEEGTIRVSAEAVVNFLESWEEAWESRDPDQLIALYSDDFTASAYGGRDAWQRDLSSQMRRAEYIRVAVSALDVTFPQADTARAAFFRSFRSNLKDETRRMVLDLEPVTGSWKIRDERFAD